MVAVFKLMSLSHVGATDEQNNLARADNVNTFNFIYLNDSVMFGYAKFVIF